MQFSTKILDLLVNLDELKNADGFKKDGGAQSVVKLKHFGDELVVLKKESIDNKNKDIIMLTKLFFREAINLILTANSTLLPISGWNFFHYYKKHKIFIYKHVLATKYCEGGTLGSNLLIIKKKKNEMSEKEVQTQKFLYIYGIARGMKHLFMSKIHHRDLKTENVFVRLPKEDIPIINDKYYIPLLADLGMAKFNEPDIEASNNYGTPLYASPEQLTTKNFSFPADVYGYGVILSDILQLKKFPTFKDGVTRNFLRFRSYVKGGGKPLLNNCTEPQVNYLNKLMEKNPKDRPNFIQIVDYLETPFKKDNTSAESEPFILDDLDLDIITAYKNYLDLSQDNKTLNITDEEFYHLHNEFHSLAKQMNTNQGQNDDIPNYISSFLNTIPINSKSNESYYKEGLQYEYQKDYQNAKIAYMRAATFGSLESITKLGILLLKNLSQEKQIQGFNLLKLASEFKEKNGLYSFAYLLTEGFSPMKVKPDLKKAAELFTQAANLGHKKGWFMAGSIYHQLAFEENKKGQVKNAKKYLEDAKICYQKSFQQFNDTEANELFKEISKCLENN